MSQTGTVGTQSLRVTPQKGTEMLTFNPKRTAWSKAAPQITSQLALVQNSPPVTDSGFLTSLIRHSLFMSKTHRGTRMQACMQLDRQTDKEAGRQKDSYKQMDRDRQKGRDRQR